jgi:hypothetical protein
MGWSPYVRWIRYRDATFAETMIGRCAQVNGCRVPNEPDGSIQARSGPFTIFQTTFNLICSDKYFGGTRAAHRAGAARSGKNTVHCSANSNKSPH